MSCPTAEVASQPASKQTTNKSQITSATNPGWSAWNSPNRQNSAASLPEQEKQSMIYFELRKLLLGYTCSEGKTSSNFLH